MHLLGLFVASTVAIAGQVSIDAATWRGLQPPDALEEETAAPPAVIDRDVWLKKQGDEFRLVSRWWIHAPGGGWFNTRLSTQEILEPSATFNGRKVPLISDKSGLWLTLDLDGPGRLELRGIVPIGKGTGLNLLAPAYGSVRVDAGEQEAILTTMGEPIVETDGVFWTRAAGLSVELREPRISAKSDAVLARGRVGLGITVGEAELTGRAHLEWRIGRGSLDQVSFRATHIGSDLTVEGSAIESWKRQGDRVHVTLREPVDGLVSLDLVWTQPVTGEAESQLPLPVIRLEKTASSETSLQIARDGDLEVIPNLSGWQAVSASTLPGWGQGLVSGTSSAAYTGSGRSAKGALSLLRFTPVSGPATFVDVASYTIATTELGRSLTRAHLSVRNDRSSHLRVTPPSGATLVGVRVSNEMVTPVSDGGRSWLIPLSRSVETVDGLLSFPVEIILLAESDLWARQSEREHPLPTFDAPVAVSRVTLHLPPGFENILKEGEEEIVNEFSEGGGITYGFSTGDQQVVQADAYFQEAVSAWSRNDFDAAQDNLDSLRAMGADNKNIQRLQSNVDLVSVDNDAPSAAPQSSSSNRVALERRIKEQARARADKDVRRQEVMLLEAEEQFMAGDYEAAEEVLSEALAIGGMLEKLEQKESVEAKSQNAAIIVQLKGISKKKKDKSSELLDEVAEDVEIIFDLDDESSLLLDGGMSGLIGAKGDQAGSGGLGSRGSGLGGGGTAGGLGGLGTKGVGSGAGGYGSGAGRFGSKRTSAPMPAPPVTDKGRTEIDFEGVEVSGMLSAPAGVVVTATALSVIIPAHGERIRYQHLLLPPDTPLSIMVKARRTRRN